ncbi:MAG: major capsid protein [Bilophila wadsworthia]
MPIQNYPTVFDCTEMTAAVNKLPARPFFFKPLFEVKGVKTTTVSLDIRKGRIVLIGDSERNTAPEPCRRGAKRGGSTSPARIWRRWTRWPPKTFRTCGRSAPPSRSVAAVYNDKMQQLKDNLAATMEFHRLGAIKRGARC